MSKILCCVRITDFLRVLQELRFVPETIGNYASTEQKGIRMSRRVCGPDEWSSDEMCISYNMNPLPKMKKIDNCGSCTVIPGIVPSRGTHYRNCVQDVIASPVFSSHLLIKEQRDAFEVGGFQEDGCVAQTLRGRLQ